MKIIEFQPELQQVAHDFVTEVQAWPDLEVQEAARDWEFWMLTYIHWLMEKYPDPDQRGAPTTAPDQAAATGLTDTPSDFNLEPKDEKTI